MKKSKIITSVLIMIFFNSTICFSQAEMTEIEMLRMEINILKDKINSLEIRLNEKDAGKSAPKITSDEKNRTPENIIDSFAREIQVHGFVDSSYIFNTNTPTPPNPLTNNLRVFDRESNGFMLNMAQLNIEKSVSKISPIGFRIDLDYGQDAELIHSNGLGNAGDPFDLQQAYGQIMLPYSLPLIDELNFKVGKFVTLLGAEVIESMNNWNFSRSYLFGYAIPFTLTGIRMYYKPCAGLPLEAYVSLVNGWDQTTDLNRAKSVEAQISVTPTDKLSLAVGGIVGAERADSNKDTRNLIDFVAAYKATDKLTFKVNYDYGLEINGVSDFAGYDVPKNAFWDGVACYARYDILDWWSVAGRGEFFHDKNGVRTAFLTNAAMPISDLGLWEFTLTNEVRFLKNFIARLEYRYDKASGQAFTKAKETSNNQSTISAEVIAKF